MQITITDYKNKDYQETKELNPSDLVDLVAESVEAGKWGETQWLKFGFQEDASWDSDCANFIEGVAKEIAIRDVILKEYKGLGFKNPNKNKKGAAISREQYSSNGEAIYAYIVRRRDDNDNLLISGFQSGSARPMPAQKIDRRLTPLNVGFPDLKA